MFEIVPSSIQVLPGDAQALRLRVTSQAPLWSALTNATVNAERELEPINPALPFTGYGAHLLKSGIGQAVFLLTEDVIPPSGGYFGVNIQDHDSSVFIAALIDGTAGTLAFLNEGGTIFSMAYTPTPGDTLALEVSGSIWRGYLNGEEKASYVPVSGIDYPCFWTASANPPFPATPKIEAPTLIGDWSGIGAADWIAPTQGSLAETSGPANVYDGGSVPGRYIVAARFGASDLQRAEAEIIIPPLMLAMPDAIIVPSGAQIELLTNYDEAQSNLVTWAALDGGALSLNRWTAPYVPGEYRLRATAGTQRVTTVATVPISILPASNAGQKNLKAIGKAATIPLETNLASATWACERGVIVASGPFGANYTAPVTTGKERLTVTSGDDSFTLIVEIVEVWTSDPTYGYAVEIDKKVVVADAESGERYGRVKTPLDKKDVRYELKFEGRDLPELSNAEEFWHAHFPHRLWLYHDKFRGEKVPVYFDSAIKYEAGADCSISYSFRARSA